MEDDETPLQNHIPRLIIQDQAPDQSQQQIVDALEALQGLAGKVLGRVQERAKEEQERLDGIMKRMEALNERVAELASKDQGFVVTASARFPQTDTSAGWRPLFPTDYDLRQGPEEAVPPLPAAPQVATPSGRTRGQDTAELYHFFTETAAKKGSTAGKGGPTSIPAGLSSAASLHTFGSTRPAYAREAGRDDWMRTLKPPDEAAMVRALAQVSTSAIHAVGHGKTVVSSHAASVPRPHPLPQGPRLLRDAPRPPPTAADARPPPTLRHPDLPPSTPGGHAGSSGDTRSGDTRLPPGVGGLGENGRGGVDGLREPDRGLLGTSEAGGPGGVEGGNHASGGSVAKVAPEARVRPPSVTLRPPSRGPRFSAPLPSPWRQPGETEPDVVLGELGAAGEELQRSIVARQRSLTSQTSGPEPSFSEAMTGLEGKRR